MKHLFTSVDFNSQLALVRNLEFTVDSDAFLEFYFGIRQEFIDIDLELEHCYERGQFRFVLFRA